MNLTTLPDTIAIALTCNVIRQGDRATNSILNINPKTARIKTLLAYHTRIDIKMTNLYETDFFEWTKIQARALSEHNIEALDWNNLKEEIEDLGNEKLALPTIWGKM